MHGRAHVHEQQRGEQAEIGEGHGEKRAEHGRMDGVGDDVALTGLMLGDMVMRSKTGTVRIIEAHHNFDRKSGFGPMDR